MNGGLLSGFKYPTHFGCDKKYIYLLFVTPFLLPFERSDKNSVTIRIPLFGFGFWNHMELEVLELKLNF